MVTETWLRDRPELDSDLYDLEMGANLKAITLNRLPNNVGVAHGGVAVFYKKNVGNFRRIKFDNPELLPVVVTLQGTARKVVIVVA